MDDVSSYRYDAVWEVLLKTVRIYLMTALALVACGDDDTSDAGPGPDATETDGAPTDVSDRDSDVASCSGMADGTVCGESQICVGEACLNSRCGDGYVDEAADEICDDGNEISGDGCEPSSCAYSCTTDEETCSDGDPCNGTESCDIAIHRCQAGTEPAEETACEQDGGEAGVCSGGLCASPGCGNGTVEAGEDCDDMNDDQDDGCKSDCTFSCVMDVDCTDGDTCTGQETCDVATHICENPADLECDDADTCTSDSCDAELGCVYTLIDGDEDGYSEDVCTTPGLNGGDCNDSNDAVYPGAPELCDGSDNDCDDETDEDIVEVECRMDTDMDGYGDDTVAMSACTCPAGYFPPRPDGELDCRDGNASVSPGQTSYFTSPFCNSRATCGDDLSFDYNCDGVITPRYPNAGSTACGYISAGGFFFCGGGGWTGDTVPECGQAGVLRRCSIFGGGCTGSTSLSVQECR